MSLPQLYAVPTDDVSWMAWAWNHQANHFDIVKAGTTFQQTSLTLTTNIGSLAGGFVLGFAGTTGVKIGMSVSDTTTPLAIAEGSQVNALNATEVQIGIPLPNNVGSGDNIFFGPGSNVLPLTQYQLSPVDPNNMGVWFYQHQIMHNQINLILGTQGFNLLDYDWSDEDQLQEWMNQNASEHQTICSALGIG
jgi:hypothetical protein